jgi:hypothetical protein
VHSARSFQGQGAQPFGPEHDGTVRWPIACPNRNVKLVQLLVETGAGPQLREDQIFLCVGFNQWVAAMRPAVRITAFSWDGSVRKSARNMSC